MMRAVMVSSSFVPSCNKGLYDCQSCVAEKGCDKTLYFCRHVRLAQANGKDISCKDYSFFSYQCTHGGGLACAAWRD